MNKQRKTYILLVAVIIIWSIVGFQFLGYLNPDEEIPEEVQHNKFVPKATQEKEKYRVSPHERDPFLGKYNKPKKVVKRAIKVEKEPVHFPQILYKGVITSGNKQLFIITVNGEQKVIRLNQSVNDLKVISGNAKEIKIKYKGEVKTYLK